MKLIPTESQLVLKLLALLGGSLGQTFEFGRQELERLEIELQVDSRPNCAMVVRSIILFTFYGSKVTNAGRLGFCHVSNQKGPGDITLEIQYFHLRGAFNEATCLSHCPIYID
jgi:hypothetical protein